MLYGNKVKIQKKRAKKTLFLWVHVTPPPLFIIFFSEAEPAGPGGVGQRLDAPVVDVAPAVKRHSLDVGRLAQLGDPGTDELGGALVPARRPAQLLPDLRGQRRGRDERRAGGVVDDLGVDVVVGAEDGEARPLGLALELFCFWFFGSLKGERNCSVSRRWSQELRSFFIRCKRCRDRGKEGRASERAAGSWASRKREQWEEVVERKKVDL